LKVSLRRGLVAGLLAGTLPLPPSILLLSRFYPSRYADPLRPLRIIGGIVPGGRSARADILAGLALHLVTSATLGAAFTPIVDRYAGRPIARRALAGALLGTAQWVLSYYGFLKWYYPAQVEADPLWVAASTHAGFGAAVAVLT
jgi:hypothetical protein